MRVVGYYKKYNRPDFQLDILKAFLSYFKNDDIFIFKAEKNFEKIKSDLCVIIGWREYQRDIAKYYSDVPIISIITPPIRNPKRNVPIDKSYFGIFWSEPYGNLTYLKELNLSGDRWKQLKKNHSIKIKPWRKIGNRIIIAHQSNLDFCGNSRDEFYEEAVYLSLKTGRDVVVCERPIDDNWKIKEETKLKWKNLGCKFVKGVKNNLHDSYCMITSGGTTDSIGIFKGVPVYTKETRISTPLMNEKDLSKFLKDPPTPDRAKWFNWIAYQQWTLDEIKKGLPHKYLFDKSIYIKS